MPDNTYPPKRSRFIPRSLEPRVLFDGAMAGDIDNAASQNDQAEFTPVNYSEHHDAAETNQSAPKEIIFIDGRIDQADLANLDLPENADVHVIDLDSDGAAQMAEIMAEYDNVSAVHIIAHGEPGALELGQGVVDLQSITGAQADEFAAMASSLTDDADILIYGCNFAQSEQGELAAKALATLTQADVTASDDFVGLGGDGELEYATGDIETQTLDLTNTDILLFTDAEQLSQFKAGEYVVNATEDTPTNISIIYPWTNNNSDTNNDFKDGFLEYAQNQYSQNISEIYRIQVDIPIGHGVTDGTNTIMNINDTNAEKKFIVNKLVGKNIDWDLNELSWIAPADFDQDIEIKITYRFKVPATFNETYPNHVVNLKLDMTAVQDVPRPIGNPAAIDVVDDVQQSIDGTAYFNEVDTGDTLTYSLGANTPNWITVNQQTGEITIDPDSKAYKDTNGNVTFQLIATDSKSDQGIIDLTLNLTNPGPSTTGAIANTQSFNPDQVDVDLSLLFNDDDTLAFTLAQNFSLAEDETYFKIENGKIVVKDASNLPPAGDYEVKVTATEVDDQGLFVTGTVKITINNVAPAVVGGTIGEQEKSQTDTISIDLKPFFYETGSFTVSFDSGQTNPNWLEIVDGKLQLKAGQSAPAGSHTIYITANDGSLSTNTSFTLTITNPAPVVTAFTNVSATEGQAITPIDIHGNISDDDAYDVTISGLDGTGLTYDASTGKITGTVATDFVGYGNTSKTVTITVTVTDQDENDPKSANVQTFDLTIINPAPNVDGTFDLVAAGLTQVEEAQSISVDISGLFQDDDTALTYTISGAPTGLGITGSNVVGQIGNATKGTYNVTITASDPQGAETSHTFTMVVTEPAIKVSTVIQDVAYQDNETISSIDFKNYFQDDDDFTITASDYPTGLTLVDGVLSGKIDPSASLGGTSGVYTITVTATSDDGSSISQQFDLTVTNPTPTVISALADVTQNDGEAVSISLANVFADDDALTLSVTGLPMGLKLEGNQITGTLAADASANGPYTIEITAQDTSGASVKDTFQLTVENPTPVINLSASQEGIEGSAFTWDLKAGISDPDGDTLTITLDDNTKLPAGLSFANGVISGTIDKEAKANSPYLFKVIVDDNQGGKVEKELSITVENPAPTVDGTFDLVAAGLTQVEEAQSISVDISGLFQDDDTAITYTISGGPTGLGITGSNVVGQIGNATKGTYNVTITASDPQGAETSHTFTMVVTEPAIKVSTVIQDVAYQDNETISSIDFKNYFQDDDDFTITASDYPTGLTLVDGVLSGKIDPSASLGGTSGVYTITVTATSDDGSSISQQFDLTVTNPVPTVISALADVTKNDGEAVSISLANVFADDDALTLSVTGLPMGLKLEGNQITGTLAADASANGPYTIEITAQDTSGASVKDTFQLTVENPTPVINLSASQEGIEGSAFTWDLKAGISDPDGDTLTITLDDNTKLPAGLSFANGVISGTIDKEAKASSPYQFKVIVDDGQGGKVEKKLSITVENPAPIVNTNFDLVAAGLTQVEEAQSISVDISGLFQDDDTALTYTISGAPTGLGITGSNVVGQIGNATKGTYNVTITASDPQGAETSHTFTMVVTEPAIKVSTVIQDVAYQDNETISSIDFKNYFQDDDDFTITASDYPTGLTLVDGVLSGKIDPSASLGGTSGVYTITVTATSDDGSSISQQFDLTVTNPVPTVISALADVTKNDGEAVSISLANVFADDDALTLSVTGLPMGLKLEGNQITGTLAADASANGPYTIEITAQDTSGASVKDTFQLTVENPTPVINLSASQEGIEGSAFTWDLKAGISDPDGDTLTITLDDNTKLPAGLSFANGVISGTIDKEAKASSPYQFKVIVDDGQGGKVEKKLSITVENPAPIVNTNFDLVAAGLTQVEEAQSISVDISGLFQDDDTALTYTISGAPTGLGITGSNVVGQIGNATKGTYNVTITASDPQGAETSHTFTMVVTEPAIKVSTVIQDVAYQDNETISSIDFKNYFQDDDDFTITASDYPTGLTLVDGVLSGKIDPSASLGGTSGVYTITVTATSDDGSSISQQFDLTVTNPVPTVISALADVTKNDGEAVSISLANVFADDDALTLSVTGLPMGLKLEGNQITGTLAADASANGPYTIEITAQDTSGASVKDTFQLTVENPTPVINGSFSAQTYNEGTQVEIKGSGIFSDDDVLNITSSNLPNGLSIEQRANLITNGDFSSISDWSVKSGDALSLENGKADLGSVDAQTGISQSISTKSGESYQLVINVSSDADRESLVVKWNGTIIFDGAAAQPNASQTLILTVTGTGGNDQLTLSEGTSAHGDGPFVDDIALYDLSEPLFKIVGTIAKDAAGTTGSKDYNITLTAQDTQGKSVDNTTLTITVENPEPVINLSASQQGIEGSAFTWDLKAGISDPDGDTLTITLDDATKLPAGLSFADGVISGTIDKEAKASSPYQFKVIVDDGQGGTIEKDLSITVENPGPVLNVQLGNRTFSDGDVVDIEIDSVFSDPDGDTLTYSFSGGPDGITVTTNPDGKLAIYFTLANDASAGGDGSGKYAISMTASDGDKTTSQTFEFNVGNNAPTTKDKVADQTYDDAEQLLIDVSNAFQDDDTFTVSMTGFETLSGLSYVEATQILSGQLDKAASQGGSAKDGEYTIKIVATDAQGAVSQEQEFKITVTNPGPTMTATAPLSINQIDNTTKTIEVAGYFNDKDWDKLSYSLVNAPTFVSIDENSGQITSVMPANGSDQASYTFQVLVTDADEAQSNPLEITLNTGNPAPTVQQAIASITKNDGEWIRIDTSGVFSDDDAFTIDAVSGLPAGLKFENGIISGHLAADASQGGTNGKYTITLTAKDAQGKTTSTDFTITAVNPAPTLNGTLQNREIEDGTTGIEISFENLFSDEDTLEYTVTGLPDGLKVEGNKIVGDLSASASAGGTNGEYTITIKADDKESGTTETTFKIQAKNIKPTLVGALSPATYEDSTTVNIPIKHLFNDEDSLTYTLQNAPTGLSIVNGAIVGTIDNLASAGGTNGLYNITIIADDGLNSVETNFLFTTVNKVPQANANWSNLGLVDPSYHEGSSVNIDLSGIFTDDDTITLSVQNLPSSLTFANNIISGTLDSDAANSGPYKIEVIATDQQNTASATYFIDFVVVNPSPTVNAALSSESLVDGQSNVSIVTQTAFLDDDKLTYEAEDLPKGLSIDKTTGEITGTVDSAASAESPYTVVIKASDPQGGYVATELTITITNPVPTVSGSVGNQSFEDGQTITPIDLTDLFTDDDSIEITALNLPKGLKIDGTEIVGTIDPMASAQGTGVYEVVLTATDTQNKTTDFKFKITVSNPAPVKTNTLENITVFDGATVDIDLSSYFSDDDGLTFAATDLPKGLAIVGNKITGVMDAEASITGTYNITVKAQDDQGLSITQDFVLTAENGAPKPATPTGTSPFSVVYFDGQDVKIDISEFFEDDDQMTLLAQNLPAGLVLEGNYITGQIHSSASQKGAYAIELTATDTQDASFIQQMSMLIENPKPIISALDDVTLHNGQEVSIDLESKIIDDDGFAITIENLPKGLEVKNGKIVGTFDSSSFNGQPKTFNVVVTDADGETAIRQFSITPKQAEVIASPPSSPQNPNSGINTGGIIPPTGLNGGENGSNNGNGGSGGLGGGGSGAGGGSYWGNNGGNGSSGGGGSDGQSGSNLIGLNSSSSSSTQIGGGDASGITAEGSGRISLDFSNRNYTVSTVELSERLFVESVSNGDNMFLNFASQFGASVSLKIVGDVPNVRSTEFGSIMIMSDLVPEFSVKAVVTNGAEIEEFDVIINPATKSVEILETQQRGALLSDQLSNLSFVMF